MTFAWPAGDTEDAHAASTDYQAFGWRIRSAMPLAGLLRWCGDDRAPDISINYGDLAATLPGGTDRGPFLQTGPGGIFQLTVRNVARFHVAGDRVTIDPQGDPAIEDIKTFLLGSVMGILCHQRGMLPLHASAVEIDGRALAFAGISGSGKSTLAATLVARGHRLLTDDIAAIDPAAPEGALLFPGFPRLKLWKDSLATLRVDPAGLPRVRTLQDKFALPMPAFDPKPVRLHSVYGLCRVQHHDPIAITPQSGRDATAMLSNNVYRAAVAPLLGRQAALFASVIQLARGVRTYVLPRCDDLGTLDTLATRVTEHARAAAA